MWTIFSVTVPFFALVLCGYLAGRLKFLPDSAIPGLNAYVLYFALPCMLFLAGMNTPVKHLLDLKVIGMYMACACVIVGLTIAVTWSKTTPLPDAAFGALVAAFPNSGFMGVPMLLALMGPVAAGPIACTMLTDMIFTTSVCIGISQTQGGASQGARVAMLRALKGVARNPMAWAITAGALASFMGWILLPPLAPIVKMLGESATPVALFTIGAVLSRASLDPKARTPVSQVLPVVLIKLLVHPSLVFLVMSGAVAWGVGLTASQITTLTLVAALPSASNVAMLTERYGANTGRIARIILWSTSGAFATFSVVAWFFGVRPAG